MGVTQTKKEFMKFLVIGCVNTGIGVVLSAGMALILEELPAFLIGYYISLIISYFLNSKFVFQEAYTVKKLFQFQLSYIPNFLIQLVAVYVLVGTLVVAPIIVYALSAAISVPVTFIMLKMIAFNGGGKKQ